MSETGKIGVAEPTVSRFKLWERQIAAIFAVEIRKSFISGRAMPVYLLAAAPTALVFLVAVTMYRLSGSAMELMNITTYYAQIYQLLLRSVVFFGCAWIFTNLFRGEILDRSLHYYFLVPVRREVLVAGKFVTGLFGCMMIFGVATVVPLVVLHFGHPPTVVIANLLGGSGLSNLLDYLATTALACLGYGSVFMLASLFFKNPFIPALALWGWEWLNFALPALLKKLSIVYYAQSLIPIAIDEGPFAVIADPISRTAAVAGLLALTAVCLVLAAFKVRRMEIAYGLE